MKPRVLISIPTSPGHPFVHKYVFNAVLKLQKDDRVTKDIINPSKNPYENNLNHIVNYFMNDDYNFWINIDSDNPPIRNIIDLIFFDKDIIGCPTPVWHFTGEEPIGESPIYWNGYDLAKGEDGYKEHKIRNSLQEVDAIGTGCFVIARRIFENPEMRQGPFMRKWNKDGTVDRGNDICFSERAKQAGFEIFCHYGYPCLHFNIIELNEAMRAFSNMFNRSK